MRNMTLDAFAAQTASKDPVPGGGSISALAGALAAALTEMVAGLTIGREKYKDVEAEMEAVVAPMQEARDFLLDAVLKDSQSFDLYMQALPMPKNTEEEKAARTQAMQNGLKAAVMVPLGVARQAVEILPLAGLMVKKGNATAVTDGLVATMMARSAALGALYNVKINLQSIKDEAFVAEIKAEVAVLEEKAQALETEIRSCSGL